jgi:23S rRNA (uracil1939-C5)-methyltransferase
MSKTYPILTLKIEELDDRGYGIANHENKQVQVLNALPGEIVEVEIFGKKKRVLQGVAQQVLQASPQRIPPREEHFLSCSPWQILDFASENQVKIDLIKKFFEREQIDLPDFEIINLPDQTWNYRNKAEFSFSSFDTEPLSLAFFRRDTQRSKFRHDGCVLMAEPINIVGRKVVDFLNAKGIQYKQLKSLVLRYCYAENKVVAALFVKDENLKFEPEDLTSLLDKFCQGFILIYSTHKSPASVVTGILQQVGDLELKERILETNLSYRWNDFFQVNPPVFELAVKDMIEQIKITPDFDNLSVVDMYAGVGTLGLLVAPFVQQVCGVEVTPGAREQAVKNAALNRLGNFEFIEGLSEKCLEAVAADQLLIVDPPRAGLHDKLIGRILAESPKHIIYLSCNPQTQAANYAALQEKYRIRWMRAYNFYPHTPHSENLLVLDRKCE